MNEPDWTQFKINELYDASGVAQRKVTAFMHAFIGWREAVKADGETAVKVEEPEARKLAATRLVTHDPPNKNKRKRASQ